MRKKILVFFLILNTLYLTLNTYVLAVDCNNTSSLELPDIQTCLNSTGETLDLISKANQTNKGNLKALQNQVANLKKQLDGLSSQLDQKQTEINSRNRDFDQEYTQLSNRVRSFYIANYNSNILTSVIGSRNVGEALRNVHTFSFLARRNKEAIANLVTSISDLQKEKELLSGALARTAGLKAQVDRETEFLAGEVAKAGKYEQQLSGQIAALSARQQEILTSRSGTFTVSIGDSELADDYNASIKGFRESAPGGYFAVFSFGAYTHRNGMSQYGALGRSKSKSTEEILSFYYPGKELKKDYSEPSKIHVKGLGKNCDNNDKNYDEDVDFQTYMKRIYEVPGTWPDTVLKAQAVAARSYAINRMNGAGFVAPNEGAGGQVYKDCDKGGGWASAVDATRSWVLTSGGTAAFTEFSSTAGGWINGVGWDTTDGQGGSNFVDKSFEKVAGSPWVYKAWYTEKYSIYSDKCGRANPWLSPEEMADIVNAAIALKIGGIDTLRITPVTTSCWGGNPYSMDELRNLVAGNGGISSANNVSVSQGDGNTNNVTINGVSFSGTEFKKAFNLRAPGRLSIPQSGFAFFNIEKK